MQVFCTCYVWILVYFQFGFHNVFLAFFGTFFSLFTKKFVIFLVTVKVDSLLLRKKVYANPTRGLAGFKDPTSLRGSQRASSQN